MLQAMVASFKSKDPNTKVGSVIVDDANHQISMGYNGFVSGIDESQLPWGGDKSAPLEDQKYAYVVHSEANALLHATKSVEGARLYVTLFPCHECAKLIAAKKVKEVVYHSDKYLGSEGNRIAKKIFALSGVKYRQLSLRNEIIDHLKQHFDSVTEEL